jgi:hypothetical protein
MARRQPKPEPFSIEELEEISRSPALQGFDKVLRLPVLVPDPQDPGAFGLTHLPTMEAGIASTVEDALPSTVEYVPTSIVEAGSAAGDLVSPSTVEGGATSTVEDGTQEEFATFGQGPVSRIGASNFWVADGVGGLFSRSRIKRISQAQDALTHVEEAVYDALWGPKKKEAAENHRLAQMGYAELAKKARVSKRSIQSVIDRLIAKLFLDIEAPADIFRRKPTVYRVYSYAAILKRLRENGHVHTVQTGRGIFYAHAASTVEAGIASTVEAGQAGTVAARTPSTVEATSTSTVEDSSIGNSLGTKIPGITSSAVTTVARAIIKILPVDDDAVRQLIVNCRGRESGATAEEIAYAAEIWLRQNIRNTSLRKPVAVMLTAVPKFFPSEMMNAYRLQRQEEKNNIREFAENIINDPDSTESDRAWARAQLLEES